MDILLSICIPSYNRGTTALNTVNSLLPYLDIYNDIEIVLSDNGSTVEVDDYKKIESIDNDRVVYCRLDVNQFYWGNINNVIKASRGLYTLILSDEDRIKADGLNYYINILRELRANDDNTIGIIRGASNLFYRYEVSLRMNECAEKIKNFFVQGNYVSGIIYNRSLLTDALIDSLFEEYMDNEAYRLYTHLIFDLYLLLIGDIMIDSNVLIEEGEPGEPTAGYSGEYRLLNYATIENRLSQIHSFVQIIKGMKNVSESVKNRLLMTLISKYSFLVGLTVKEYKRNNVPVKYLTYALKGQFFADLIYINLPSIKNNWDIWEEYVNITVDSDTNFC